MNKIQLLACLDHEISFLGPIIDELNAEDADGREACAARARLNAFWQVRYLGGCRMVSDCIFCMIINGEAPATIVREWSHSIAIEPLNPVTPGHTLVIPRLHVSDATTSPDVTAVTMNNAAEIAVSPCNLIISAGVEATQTVFHLHIHIVPRHAEDGLRLPWTVT